MSAITPPQPAGPTTTVAPASGQVQVSNPPRALLNLALETVVKGEVIATTADGRAATVLRTPIGPLTLTGNLPLPLGATVTLSLQSVGIATQMLVLTVNGKPFSSLRGMAAAPGGGGAKGGTPAATGQKAPATAASGGTAKAAGAAGGRGTALIPGATIQITLAKAASPSPAGDQSAANAGAVRLGTLTLQPGMPVAARVIAIGGGATPVGTPAGTASPATAGAATPAKPAQQVSGTVVASNSSGQPVLQTSIGWLTLPAGTRVPAGATVTLEFTGSGVAAGRAGAAAGSQPQQPTEAPATVTAKAMAAQDALLRGFGTRRWDSLTEALNVLQASDPALAQTVMNTTIPQANAQLTSNMLFFLTALRGGDLRSWLGDSAMRGLERAGRGDLVNRLSDEFSQLARGGSEPAADWRMMLVPFYNQQQFEQLRMFWRRGGEDGDGDASRTDTRFVIDVELSRMGHLQLDGLVRPRRLDLVIRTATPLPAEVRREINTVYGSASEAVGLSGGLSFQAHGEFIDLSPPRHREGMTEGLVV